MTKTERPKCDCSALPGQCGTTHKRECAVIVDFNARLEAARNRTAIVIQTPAEQEAACWRVIEPWMIETGYHLDLTSGWRGELSWRAMCGPSEHFGATRLDALAQLAQALELEGKS